jgi:hypothetical protein
MPLAVFAQTTVSEGQCCCAWAWVSKVCRLFEAAIAPKVGAKSNAIMISAFFCQFIGPCMRRRAAIACALLVVVIYPAYAADPMLPNPQLTPGAVLTTDLSKICQPGYSRTVRRSSGALKHKVYAEYGIKPDSGHYEIDHLIPLELGGADVRGNLWPESYDTEPGNAHIKDHLENYLHEEVCAGRIPIEEAQREIAEDWIAAYLKYMGDPR